MDPRDDQEENETSADQIEDPGVFGSDERPKPKYRNGEALFLAKYAEEFYEANPDKKDIPYGKLKEEKPIHPMIEKVKAEYSEENMKHLALEKEWNSRHPEEAKRIDEAKKKASAARKERKRLALERKHNIHHQTSQTSLHPRPDWLNKDFMEKFEKMRDENIRIASALLQAGAQMSDAMEEFKRYKLANDEAIEDAYD